MSTAKSTAETRSSVGHCGPPTTTAQRQQAGCMQLLVQAGQPPETPRVQMPSYITWQAHGDMRALVLSAQLHRKEI